MEEEKKESLWEISARKVGRPPVYNHPDEMWADALAYFKWAEDNPLWEAKAFAFQGVVTVEKLAKMRAFTLDGFLLHSGLAESTWYDYKVKPEFSGVAQRIDKAIREQKFTGAAADLLNSNIIARDLGLKDNVSNEHTGANGGPIETTQISREEYKAMIAKVKGDDDC